MTFSDHFEAFIPLLLLIFKDCHLLWTGAGLDDVAAELATLLVLANMVECVCLLVTTDVGSEKE